ncbi:unnamed protein product [Peronospora farinosa]|uniref:RxLR effector protein n=1 Tax=Peronospora farinosa TaxID=134698 RepID=A0AAV0TM96_9STRA|nr:unnamed protein product [Peronospora farinosa]CAI5724245.1 unnamed protein product [Peronospora farinosa]
MRLYCTVLLVAAVAIVNTNALVDDDGEERAPKLLNFFKGSSSTTFDDTHKSILDHLSKHESLSSLLQNHESLQELKRLTNTYNAKAEDSKTMYFFIRSHFKDENLINDIIQMGQDGAMARDYLTGEWLRATNPPPLSEIKKLSKTWGAKYEDEINEELASIVTSNMDYYKKGPKIKILQDALES